MSDLKTSVERYPLAALARCERGATALTYVMVLALVAISGSVAFAQFGDSVRSSIRAETMAAKAAHGEDVDGPTGSLAAEVAQASAEQLVVQGSWALAAKAGSRGMASARRSGRGRGALAFNDPKSGRGADSAQDHSPPSDGHSPPTGAPDRPKSDPTPPPKGATDRPKSDPTPPPKGTTDRPKGDPPPNGSPKPAKDEPTPSGTCRNGQCKPGEGTRCFVAGTAVATPFGPRPIEQIEPGDLVLSRDEESGEFSERSVAATFITLDAPLVEVRTVSPSDEVVSVRATPGHLFWTAADSWVRADQLVSGDALSSASEREVRVLGVETVPERATVYNFEVEGTHTYFVGPTSLWVHNMTSGEDAWRKGMAGEIDLLDPAGHVIDPSDNRALTEYLQRHSAAGNTLAVDAFEASMDRMIQSELDAIARDGKLGVFPREEQEKMLKQLKSDFKTDLQKKVADARATLAAHQDVKEVPKEIHLVWFGEAMKTSAADNVGAWGEKAKGTAYGVTLWTDEDTLKNLEQKFVLDAQGKKKSQAEILREKGVNIRTDVRNQLSDEMKKHFDTYLGANEADRANQPKNYHLGSDISRYGILEKQGGIYMDVDIAPGTVNLDRPTPKMSTNDVPAFGPMFRTKSDWGNSIDATKKFGFRSDGKKAADAVDHKYNSGATGNHFIIAPKDSTFLRDLNDRIARDLNRRDPRDVTPGVAVVVTGPGVIAAVQDDFTRNNGVRISKPADQGYIHGIKRHEKDNPNWTTVQWVTAESDNLGMKDCD